MYNDEHGHVLLVVRLLSFFTHPPINNSCERGDGSKPMSPRRRVFPAAIISTLRASSNAAKPAHGQPCVGYKGRRYRKGVVYTCGCAFNSFCSGVFGNANRLCGACRLRHGGTGRFFYLFHSLCLSFALTRLLARATICSYDSSFCGLFCLLPTALNGVLFDLLAIFSDEDPRSTRP